ncbi:MAG TPA: bifunctional YncE family protein/alkaline phosphatase family protein [Acidobacteriota bacterium]|nr:bifunctional YncE family protein/alkaline phosphatase family protein [Acidobacteriota bacterium]
MKRIAVLSITGICLLASSLLLRISAEENVPGSQVTMLPNGWKISPAGQQIPLDDFPINFLIDSSERTAIVLHSGHSEPVLAVIDLARGREIQRLRLRNAWLGMVRHPRTGMLYVSGGGENNIYKFRKNRTGYVADGEIVLAEPRKADVFTAGLAISKSGSVLYVVCNLSKEVRVVDTSSGRTLLTFPVGKNPYNCVLSSDEQTLFVSNWGDGSVSMIHLLTGEIEKIPVGPHPNDMKLDRDGKLLFVANANNNTVSVVHLGTRRVLENIRTSITEKAPEGSTPNALALSADGRTLLVANADNNDIAVVHLAPETKGSLIRGFIPTGWYPTGVALSEDGATIYVLNGKGSRSFPNPQGPNPYQKPGEERQFIGSLMKGTLSIIPYPTDAVLRNWTDQTFRNTPYRDELLRLNSETMAGIFSQFVGSESRKIKHIIYIIKENRTYDQVFGDIPRGNGDSSLVLFGEAITPNHHALAKEFALLDNFFVDSEVSADGHNWSMGAYATDYVEKTWPGLYADRGRKYDYEGENSTVFPESGYIWDAAKRAHVTYRSYGEFIQNGPKPTDPGKALVPALEGNFDPYFRSFDLEYPDQKRADRFISEFRRLVSEDKLPRLQIIRLPNDHTAGTRPGSHTPRALVADNDLALGRLVEAVSKSSVWKKTAIFVLEDDAQNGPDHVDAHRSPCLVISPYVKRHFLDHTHYTTSSVLRTIELLLGIHPMSQYDAAARPMTNLFTTEPDFAAYRGIPNGYPLDEINKPDAPGAKESMQMNFEDIDAAPDDLLNRIIWQSVHGKGAQMPPPVRSALPLRGVHDR